MRLRQLLTLTSRPEALVRFVSLRIKFGVFLSLIVIATCSALSWYFITDKQAALQHHVRDVGTILVKNLASNPRVRFAIITDDRETLLEFVEGVMAVDDVVYVVISDSNGKRLIEQTKGRSTKGETLTRASQTTVYPDPAIGQASLGHVAVDPLVTPVIVQPDKPHAVQVEHVPQAILAEFGEQERLYDFALPVLRPLEQDSVPTTLSVEQAESFSSATGNSPSKSKVVGLIQVGLTEMPGHQALLKTIKTAAWITLLIILGGVLGIVLLTNRIITPLRSLATMARRVTGGDLLASVPSTTNDEIGQLTWLFNDMTGSLKERERAIATNLATISNQVRQLTTLNQASTAISSTLDLDQLLCTLLQLLTDNLGFVRTVIVFFHEETQTLHVARAAGFPPPVQDALMRSEFHLEKSTLQADLLVRGKPVLVTDLEQAAHRLPPALLALIRQSGATSFMAAPLRGTHRILGYIAADRGPQLCTQDALDVLITLANHVAVAIDNARAYRELGILTTNLERRVEQRTKEIQSANERLQELDKLKSAFVSIVSHELRTPMTSIRGYIDNMLDGLAGPLTEKQSHYLDRVKVNADRLTHMIAELLDLSQIEAGRVELALCTMDMRALCLDVVDEFQRMASDKSIVVAVQAPASMPMVAGDRDKLHQVLTNLVGNAFKFTQGGGRIEISLTQPTPTHLQINVSDTGCGIPADELPHIFERFYRGTGVPTGARGAGLGLAIVRTLIELHGGRVWATSRPEAGSCFSFSLPLSAAERREPVNG